MPKKKKEVPKLDPDLYTKSGKLRKRKRKQSRNYFTEDTEDAIVEYLKTTDELKRNQIFNEKINYSLHKLAENIIHTFKFYYTEVDNVEHLKHEVVTFLLQKLHLYDKNKGKAYSYFGTIAKRYLIVYNLDNYNKAKLRAELEEVDEDKSIYINLVNENDHIELVEFFDKFIAYVEKNMHTMFQREVDVKTAEAVLELFRKRENIEVMNKQSFYLYVKEITGNTAPQITKVVKELKKLYGKLMDEYYLVGDIYI